MISETEREALLKGLEKQQMIGALKELSLSQHRDFDGNIVDGKIAVVDMDIDQFIMDYISNDVHRFVKSIQPCSALSRMIVVFGIDPRSKKSRLCVELVTTYSDPKTEEELEREVEELPVSDGKAITVGQLEQSTERRRIVLPDENIILDRSIHAEFIGKEFSYEILGISLKELLNDKRIPVIKKGKVPPEVICDLAKVVPNAVQITDGLDAYKYGMNVIGSNGLIRHHQQGIKFVDPKEILGDQK